MVTERRDADVRRKVTVILESPQTEGLLQLIFTTFRPVVQDLIYFLNYSSKGLHAVLGHSFLDWLEVLPVRNRSDGESRVCNRPQTRSGP